MWLCGCEGKKEHLLRQAAFTPSDSNRFNSWRISVRIMICYAAPSEFFCNRLYQAIFSIQNTPIHGDSESLIILLLVFISQRDKQRKKHCVGSSPHQLNSGTTGYDPRVNQHTTIGYLIVPLIATYINLKSKLSSFHSTNRTYCQIFKNVNL